MANLTLAAPYAVDGSHHQHHELPKLLRLVRRPPTKFAADAQPWRASARDISIAGLGLLAGHHGHQQPRKKLWFLYFPPQHVVIG
jgi:hypothetical protein